MYIIVAPQCVVACGMGCGGFHRFSCHFGSGVRGGFHSFGCGGFHRFGCHFGSGVRGAFCTAPPVKYYGGLPPSPYIHKLLYSSQ